MSAPWRGHSVPFVTSYTKEAWHHLLSRLTDQSANLAPPHWMTFNVDCLRKDQRIAQNIIHRNMPLREITSDMTTGPATTRLKVLLVGMSHRLVDSGLEMVKGGIDLTVLNSADSEDLKSRVAVAAHAHDRTDVCIILTEINHLESPGAGLNQILLHNCRLIVSVSPVYRESAAQLVNSKVDSAWPEAVISQTISLILAAAADVLNMQSHICLREWQCKGHGHLPQTVIGIVGMGRFGKCVADKAALRDMRVKYFDFERLSIDERLSHCTCA